MMGEESIGMRVIVGMLKTIAHRDKFLFSSVRDNNGKEEEKFFLNLALLSHAVEIRIVALHGASSPLLSR